MYLIVLAVSFLISLSAFVLGSRVLLKKRVPLYFRLLLAAAACYALETLCCLVTEFCGGSEEVISVSVLGILGCLLFLFCANHGAMNGLIADGNRPALFLYFISALHIAAILFISFSYWTVFDDVAAAVIMALIMAPSVPVLFWNLSHIFAKEDDFGFRSRISGCDKASVVFIVAFLAMCYSKTLGTVPESIMLLICSCAAAWLVFKAVKGAKKWNI